MDIIIKNNKGVELNAKIVSAVMNKKALKMISENKNVYVAIRNTPKKFDENLNKIFDNTCKFSNHHISKFILLL